MAYSDIDHHLLVFDLAPVGLLVAKHRQISSYNQSFCDIFGYPPEALLGRSLEVLYPSASEFTDTGSRALALMRETGNYADSRIMRKHDGSLFWCHVAGRTADRVDPFALSVWVFEDISAERPVTTALTARERQIAQFLVSGKSSKQIAADLGISLRTVEAHRGRLIRKFDVSGTNELIARLVGRV
ncbi:PAS and helix-turn-helix domain-containing protein [Diaphorobacter aerolatus]|uniref:PAS and helix-turn-helix domain-containing protein n=1 Tax=Diaphorobacter aerolatus TaxID=1288495 RepID=A0A7H0GGK5_9BURK|nr:PAS and helix-turn-helix domain-containing protein [Diaphorobacter aerolatus]QNP47421.1 PAS and helix-turn-helix domain-containing protein [Diaphorobacter aerolatus]